VLITYILATFAGFTMLFWPNRRAQAVEQRMREGDDRYFEEQRTYRSYPSMRDPRRIRIIGGICTVVGLIGCALEIYRG
jgi:hypothetical protein